MYFRGLGDLSDFAALDDGDDDSAVGAAYTDWVAVVKEAGGRATAWPFGTGIYGKYYGRPAAQFTGQGYADAANRGDISPAAIAQTTPDNQYVYVLAPDDVAAAAPKTMTTLQRVANAVFTTGDRVADALSLNSMHHAIEATGKALIWTMVAGIVILAVVHRRD
jgi:hypothetical protein